MAHPSAMHGRRGPLESRGVSAHHRHSGGRAHAGVVARPAGEAQRVLAIAISRDNDTAHVHLDPSHIVRMLDYAARTAATILGGLERAVAASVRGFRRRSPTRASART